MNKLLSANLQKSLRSFGTDLDDVMRVSNSLNCWSNALQATGSAGLVAEIFIDLYVSIHLSLFGLYKYADMALRSALETSLNAAYFSTHPVEFHWWQDGKEWYVEGSRSQHPWGDGYNYFKLLAAELPGSKAGEPLEKELKAEYKALSRSIHSASQKLQTKGAKLAPALDTTRFKTWALRFRRTLSLINIVLTICLQDRFGNMRQSDKETIKSSILPDHSSILQSVGL